MAESSDRFESHFSMIRKDMNTLGSLIRNLDQSQRYTIGTNGKATFLLHGSAIDGAASLVVIYPEIHRILLPSGPEVDTSFPKDVALWFLSQLHALLADILEDESHQMTTRPPDPCSSESPEDDGTDIRNGESTLQTLPTSKSLRGVHRDIPPRYTYSRPLAPFSPIETILIETNISTGSISMIVKREIIQAERGISRGQRMIGRTIFIPNQDSSLAGITTESIRHFDGVNRIPRTISTFGIHLDHSPIFEYLKARDICMVRKMLSERQISPNDRDESGNSLLWVIFLGYSEFQVQRLMMISTLSQITLIMIFVFCC